MRVSIEAGATSARFVSWKSSCLRKGEGEGEDADEDECEGEGECECEGEGEGEGAGDRELPSV